MEIYVVEENHFHKTKIELYENEKDAEKYCVEVMKENIAELIEKSSNFEFSRKKNVFSIYANDEEHEVNVSYTLKEIQKSSCPAVTEQER